MSSSTLSELSSDPASASAKSYPGVSLAFFLLIGFALIAPLLTGAEDVTMSSGQGNALRQLIYICLFAFILWGTGVHRDIRRIGSVPPELAIVLGYCWVSLTWSAVPNIGMRRLGLTTIVAVATCAAVAYLGPLRSLRIIRAALLIVVLASFVAVAVIPDIAIHQQGLGLDPGLVGSWRGVVGEKNAAGAACAILAITSLFTPEQISRARRLLTAFAGIVFLWGTASKTSLILTAVAIVCALLYRAYRPSYWWTMFIGGGLALIVATPFVDYYWFDLTEPFRREGSFTGRIDIWNALWRYLSNNPLLGTGYGSFWNVGSASPIFTHAPSRSWVTQVAIGHSGYLDIASQLGFPGLILVVLAVLVYPMSKLLSEPEGIRGINALLVGWLVFIIGHNFTETSFLERDMFVNVMLIVTLAMRTATSRSGPVPHIRTSPHERPGRAEPEIEAQADPKGKHAY